MSEKHLGPGSDLPPLKKDTLRLYGMRFCPCAQRIVLALNLKGIEHEVVNINTKNKPSWFIEKFPTGLVPVLEINDQIVWESVICCVYLDEVYPGYKLVAETPYQRAQDKLLLDLFLTKIARSVHAHYRSYDGLDEEQKALLLESIDKLENELKKRKSPYFRGNKPGLLDIVLWPSFERIEGMDVLDGDCLPADRFPLLTSWMDAMMDVPAVKNSLLSADQHRRFYKNLHSAQPLFDELLG
ncbi:glutathione S-transferase omega-1-like [Saccoglossus kowalevskii]|uniref:Glutathione S-transferase omega n=1 Tax=Saccoglossus kowalevskii TaxID=10224 RepID=A0ABM0GVY3_SACKO|nr:PREDICTED: glutathione S-transferase omega-1-like [Saccoglossus kowalevskii]